jgi:hypothetical protein
VPVAADAAPAANKLQYMSDCSLTNPIARDPCSGTAPTTRGLDKCDKLGVKIGQACAAGAPSCYVEQTCPDGHKVAGDYLVCVDQQPGRCLTKSSRSYKDGVHYLSTDELRDLARQVEALRLARYRYREQVGGDQRLGFLTEDAPGAPFVADDGRTVDLYALLAASIAAIQTQDERIRALEQQLGQCRKLR